MLQRCRDANLSLNKDKCVIKTQELKYLGHIISPDGVKADPAKVAAIVDMPVLESKEDVGRFMSTVTSVTSRHPVVIRLRFRIHPFRIRDKEFTT